MRGDVSKLPKWAQQEIARLERNLEGAREKLAVGPEDSNTFADPYAKPQRPLGRDTTIEFRLGEGWHETIQVKVEGDALRVMGGGSLVLVPQVTNVVRIQLKEGL